ncbi:UDP-glucose dehydrogenase family protein [Mesoterricola sediminis]|uniref:UDP-glucose 6-dehydrogenase n=1 Tax=Mesoterricola sediminis TaxID=2927980 RepID=A0AA48HE82_9BACT|nr:UDP-glucose/GDP-mannose dehydrogenase family protein [Mesoterricola sediminis]BDU76638.1 UDP-glucose 6-dehydrogenase [Mesoterricola sediminis]
MHVLVIGTGYVGLVAAAGFAEAGHKVLGIDTDQAKIDKIRKGISPIYEPGLDDLLAKHQASGTLAFSLDIRDGIAQADAAFICVGTPQSEDGSADLQYVLAVAGAIGEAMALRPAGAAPLVVVDKSTVPVGTAARVTAAIAARTDRAFEVVSNPEFLREGCAIDDFLRPDRVVIGCRTDHAEKIMRGLYDPFLQASKGQWLRMDPPSAELTKYAANAMLALRISFINEIAGLCERVGANVEYVKNGIGSDHRIGKYFLNPGPGFGGSCFPKDLQALLKVGRENGRPLRALEATVEANRHQKQVLALKVKSHYGCEAGDPAALAGRRFALWGLAFKAHTDDIREAMSLELIDSLLSLGAEVVVHDFEAMPNVRAKIGDRVAYAEDFLAACDGADALLVATEWPQYASVDLEEAGRRLKEKVMFDGRNLFRPEAMGRAGWTYHSLGRSTAFPV